MRAFLMSIVIWTCLAPHALAWDEEKARHNVLLQAINHNHTRGDYERAVDFARSGMRAGCEPCQAYYAKALIAGRGVSEDKEAGCRLATDTMRSIYFGSVVELFANGTCSPVDPIDVYASAFSATYENCQECEEMNANAGKLLARLRGQLTAEQINVAMERAYSRNPSLKDKVWWQKASLIGLAGILVWIGAVFISGVGLALWFGVRDRVRAR